LDNYSTRKQDLPPERTNWRSDYFEDDMDASHYRKDTVSYAEKVMKQRSPMEILPHLNEPLSDYIHNLSQVAGRLERIAVDKHINGPKGPWFTHKSSSECWICKQSNLISMLLGILWDLQAHGFIPKSATFKKDSKEQFFCKFPETKTSKKKTTAKKKAVKK